MKSIVFCALLSIICLACQENKQNQIKIAASSIPQAELLEFIQPELKENGIDLKIIKVDDYQLPNRLLQEKEVDANFFQHIPYLNEQSQQFGYQFAILAKVHIEPMGLYSKKIHNLSEIKEEAIVAIPNDPTNEGRSLLLLQTNQLITLNSDSLKNTPFNIKNNPKQLRFQEVDAPLLPRILQDVDLAAIPTNIALLAGLNPLKDALVLENQDSPYVNVIVVRKGDENRPELKLLEQLMTSSQMRKHIIQKYKGAIIPAF